MKSFVLNCYADDDFFYQFHENTWVCSLIIEAENLSRAISKAGTSLKGYSFLPASVM